MQIDIIMLIRYMNITSEQFQILKGIANEHNIQELTDLVNQLEPAGVEMICMTHNRVVCVSEDNFDILLTGSLVGYGAEINWCRKVDVNTFMDTVKRVIDGCPNVQHSNEMYGGRTSDTCFTNIDLISRLNICCCPNVVENSIEMGTNVMNELGPSLYPEENDKNIKDSFVNKYGKWESKHIYDRYTQSFKLLVLSMDSADNSENMQWLIDNLDTIV